MEVYCPHRDEEVKVNSSCSSSPGDRKVACGRQTSLDDAMLLPPDCVSDASINTDVRNHGNRVGESHKQITSASDNFRITESLNKLETKEKSQNQRYKKSQGEGKTKNKPKTCRKMATPEVWNLDLSVIAHAQTDSIFQTSSEDFTFSTLEDATGSLTAILDWSIDSECLTWDTQCCQDTQGESLNDWLQGAPTRGRSVESLASSLEGDSQEIPTCSILVSMLTGADPEF